MPDNDYGDDVAIVAVDAVNGSGKDSPSVSPGLSLQHALLNPGASPTFSALDGTPLHLFPIPLIDPPPALPLPLPDMARKQADSPREDHRNHQDDHPAPRPTEEPVPVAKSDVSNSAPPDGQSRSRDVQSRPPPSLSEISRLLQSQAYETQRCHQIQERLQGLQIANARTHRLASTAPAVRRTLAECIRMENKDGFVNLFNACHDVVDECSRYLPSGPRESPGDPAATSFMAGSFLNELSDTARETVLECLSTLKHDGNFIAERLANLTSREIAALLPDRPMSGPGDSVLSGVTARSSFHGSRPMGYIVDAQVNALESVSLASPLETLIHVTQGTSHTKPSDQDKLTDIWASACARLILDRCSGGDRIIPALLDVWSSMFPWPGKDRLEVWILRTIQRGAHLLEQQPKQTFRTRVHGRPDACAEEEARLMSFYSGAADSLLELVASHDKPSIIPPGALVLCRAISAKLQTSLGHQRAFPHFIITRWLFSTFIPDAVVLPETHGILTDFYISDSIRQRVLREVTARSQKAVFEVLYSWKYGNNAPPETTKRVQSLVTRFHIFEDVDLVRASRPSKPRQRHSDDEQFTVISISDVVTILNALYPLRRPSSVSSDRDTLRSGLFSSASSVSGFSMFRSPEMQHDPASDPFKVTPSIASQYAGSELDDGKFSAKIDHDENQLSLDLSRVRKTCDELGDLAANYGPSSRGFWAVLVLGPGTQLYRTLLEKCPSSFRAMHQKDSLEKLNPDIQCVKALESLLQRFEMPSASRSSFDAADLCHDPCNTENELTGLFQDAIVECEENYDFVQAHHWVRQLEQFQSLHGQPRRLEALLEHMAQTASSAITRATHLTRMCESMLGHYGSITGLEEKVLKPFRTVNERLRNKMWYIADVRNSAPYDEACIIASALKIMGKSKRLQRVRLAPPLRHWNGPKLTSGNLHLKSEAQVLDILSTKPEYGGPNKLSDEQSRATLTWMETQKIHNLCRGEERIHRLCMEIRKCVDRVLNLPDMDNSVNQSNSLFARDRMTRQPALPERSQSLLSGIYSPVNHGVFLPLGGNTRHRPATSSSASYSLSAASSRDCLDSRSPTQTSRSSFWSENHYPTSVTSVGSYPTQAQHHARSYSRTSVNLGASSVPEMSDNVRQHLTSLLLSDFSISMFGEGSETDLAFWTGLGNSLAETYLEGKHGDGAASCVKSSQSCPAASFDLNKAFDKLLSKFSASLNPFTKLQCLADMEKLLSPFMAQMDGQASPRRLPSCSDTMYQPKPHRILNSESARGFATVFSRITPRSTTIFRDMQYIASLVPSSILETTPYGEAFCSAAVAVTQLKQEIRTVMVGTADGIIAYYTNHRGGSTKSSSAAQQQRDSAAFSSPPSPIPPAAVEEVARYTMSDAAHLLQICAKEGEPAAQRELATLYLTNPELVEHILEPFARPRDVFKEELENKWRRNQDPNRCDPMTMCVAHHWMSLSSKGGDLLGKEFLRQREEMDRLP